MLHLNTGSVNSQEKRAALVDFMKETIASGQALETCFENESYFYEKDDVNKAYYPNAFARLKALGKPFYS